MSLEHLDVVIVGAGLSGVGAAYHLQTKCPAKTYAILEAREAIGGTWDLFRYPGVRSDSDMYTLGYSFRPWEGARSIVDASAILAYVRQAADDYGIAPRVRYGRRVVAAEWSTAAARWTVDVEGGEGGEGREGREGGQGGEGGEGGVTRMTCGFLLACTGYYRYDDGYTPAFKGVERFAGVVVHPQRWTEEIDYAGKRVVVIGSGATAVTLVPAMAADGRARDDGPAVAELRDLAPVEGRGRRRPAAGAPGEGRVLDRPVEERPPDDAELRAQPAASVGDEADPPQLGGAPAAGGLRGRHAFQAPLRPMGPASLPRARRRPLPGDPQRPGVGRHRSDRDVHRAGHPAPRSGEELEADLIVTATGLELLAIGGIRLAVDGREIELSETMSYKGMMLSGVPNLAIVLGYTNASWTLKVDLTCEYVCRLLGYMDAHGHAQCMPGSPDPSVGELPFIDFSSGYVRRAAGRFPMQGSKAPWRLYQNYVRDILSLRLGRVEDGVMELT